MQQYSNGVLTVIEACDKVRITKGKYSYHADTDGNIQLPLPYGDGAYIVETLRRVASETYRLIKKRNIQAANTEDYMLQPNAFVPYIPVAWDYAQLITRDQTQKAAYKTITRWVGKNIFYDYIKAVQVTKKGVVPDPMGCWERKRGICQDIASLATGMFRAVGIPARLCIGRAASKPHAWVECTVDGKVKRYDPCGTAASYTKERWY